MKFTDKERMLLHKTESTLSVTDRRIAAINDMGKGKTAKQINELLKPLKLDMTIGSLRSFLVKHKIDYRKEDTNPRNKRKGKGIIIPPRRDPVSVHRH